MRPGTLAGLPQGQENSGKTKKMTKVRKKGGFKKKIHKKKTSGFVRSNLQSSLFS